jgi:hypothetical protein
MPVTVATMVDVIAIAPVCRKGFHSSGSARARSGQGEDALSAAQMPRAPSGSSGDATPIGGDGRFAGAAASGATAPTSSARPAGTSAANGRLPQEELQRRDEPALLPLSEREQVRHRAASIEQQEQVGVVDHAGLRIARAPDTM